MSDKQAYTIDRNTLLRYLLGGSMIGLGAGAATSLANHLKVLSDKRKKLQDTSYDDDTLYVDIPAKSAFVKLDGSGEYANSGATLATSLLASVLGGMGLYNYVRGKYIQKRKNQLQSELDSKQTIYLDALQQRKQASQFGYLSRVSGTTAALMLLSALGAAATTNKVLSHYYPGFQKAKALKPKRMVIRRTQRDAKGNPMAMEKTDDSVEHISTVSPDELENLLSLKAASSGDYGEVEGLIRTVAVNGLDDVRDTIKASGVDAVLDMTSGAKQANLYMKKLAASAICHDPFMRNALALVIASDAHELMPSFCKTAAEETMDDVRDDLVGIFNDVSAMGRNQEWAVVADRLIEKVAAAAGVTKEAATKPIMNVAERTLPNQAVVGFLLADLLHRKAQGISEEPGGEDVGQASTLSSTPSVGSAEDNVYADDEADEFLGNNPELLKGLVDEVKAAG